MIIAAIAPALWAILDFVKKEQPLLFLFEKKKKKKSILLSQEEKAKHCNHIWNV